MYREDHSHWRCKIRQDNGVMCDAVSAIEESDCEQCGKETEPGAEALDISKTVIGEYVGDDVWRYYTGPVTTTKPLKDSTAPTNGCG